MTAEQLLEAGPARSAAIAAGAAALRMGIGVCGDRARALAAQTVDAAIRAALEANA